MRQLSLALVSLFSLASLVACQAPGQFAPGRLSTQAYLPPDAFDPPTQPCKPSGFQSRAALPPGYLPPCPCKPSPRLSTQAALPPDLHQPWKPTYPTQPGTPTNCRP